MERRENNLRRNMNQKRRQRYLRKRLGVTFAILFVITGVGVGTAVITADKKKDKDNQNAVAANANPVENEKRDAQKQGLEQKQEKEQSQEKEQNQEKEQITSGTEDSILQEANFLAMGYDYDGAIEKIKSFQGYENIPEMTEAIKIYETNKAECVPVNISEITHVFYHTLVVDPTKAFANQETDPQAVGNNQWMTTIDEFNKITQTMYDNGYVLVDLHDIAEETVDENGVSHFKEGTIMLPPGKKAFVLSLDDLSYYHSYDGYGYASKMVVDENGKPKCEYIQEDGTTVVGDYDAVPLLDKFIEEHPDAAYKGARGTIALTGYNGVLGYRTDISYQTVPDDINADKKKWLEEHPDFNLETERANAKKVADAMKAEGWKFASHTWGHLKVGNISFDRLQVDTTKWKENVEPVVGPVDTIIFAHGQDLAGWPEGYVAGNEKFEYLKQQGFNYFCNVDSMQYGVQIRDNYVRQSRRNLDGFRIYFNSIGEENTLSDLFNAADIIDPQRPPVHRLK